MAAEARDADVARASLAHDGEAPEARSGFERSEPGAGPGEPGAAATAQPAASAPVVPVLSSPAEVPPAVVAPPPARSWPAPLRGARAAFVFFSRVPAGGFPYRARDWHWAPAHLPLVGAAVGGISAAVFVVGAWLGLAPLLRASLAVAASVWLTGALHEDGLADTADGLGGAHGDRHRALEIMKDSRIGAFGATALMLTLLARAGAMTTLAPSAWFALVSVHVAARVVPVWLLCREPYVNDRADAKSQGLFQTRPVHVLVALGWSAATAALGGGLGWLPWPAACAAAMTPLALAPLLARYFRRRIGGVTGDVLGAAEQVTEVAAWVLLGATLRF